MKKTHIDKIFFIFLSADVAALCAGVSAMYSSGDGVVDLTASNFDREVINSDALWIIEFYAPWYLFICIAKNFT